MGVSDNSSSASPPATAQAYPGDNGLNSFAVDGGDPASASTMATLEAAAASPGNVLGFGVAPGALAAETVARGYLTQAVESPDVPELAFSAPIADQTEFKTLGTEAVPLTGTTVVKFRQYVHKIPVYGSLASVELDENNVLVAINTSTGEPIDVDPVAKISPAQAKEVALERAGEGSRFGDAQPRLYFYYDQATRDWRLVYIMQNVLQGPREKSDQDPRAGLPEYFDYVVDAHSGEFVAELPRTQTAVVQAIDDLDLPRQISVQDGNPRTMLDPDFNVRTHDFRFQDIASEANLLPGDFVANPPDPWARAAVSAHANAAAVGKFLKDVLRRNGIDNAGGAVVSSINCVNSQDPGPTEREWHNAAWIPTLRQMVYGQRMVNGALRSFAVSGDVVAHEILHGLTDSTARLEYRFMSGALNESYSDIFGIIVSNLDEPDTGQWNWELGEDLSLTGVPIRDLSDPGKHGQPAHMNNYQNLPLFDDFGGVHTNSGIHNKAAHNLLTTPNGQGELMFTPEEVAALFYLTLSQRLTSTSTFSESRRGVLSSAASLFRNQPDLGARRAAIEQAFDAVGIT